MTEIDEIQQSAYDQGYLDRDKIAIEETASLKLECDLYMSSAKALIDDLKEQTSSLRNELEEAKQESQNFYDDWKITEHKLEEERAKSAKLVEALKQYYYLENGEVSKLTTTPTQRHKAAHDLIAEYEGKGGGNG